MKKILFFDSWKGGIRNFYRLNSELQKIKLNPLLIHLSSWEKDFLGEKEEIVNGLLARDISYYKGLSFSEIIDIEKPDIVLLLSVNTFAHWAFVRLCNNKNIPTIFLFCGLLSVQSGQVKNTSSFELNYVSFLKKIYTRIPRLLKYALPVYARALLETDASTLDWIYFFRMIFFSALKPAVVKSLKNVRTTHCIIYAKSDMASALNLYGYKESEISIVGNPDFMQFDFDDYNHLEISGLQDSCDYVIYIDTALLASGYYFKNLDQFLEHLLLLNEEIQRIGKKMVLKPHPDTINLYDLSLLSSNGILIIGNDDLMHFLGKSYCVLTEPSTLSIVPCALGLPVLLVNFGKLKGIKFGSSLVTYPKSAVIDNISQINSVVIQLRNKNLYSELYEWRQFNVGPIPFSEMPQRVAQVIIMNLQ